MPETMRRRLEQAERERLAPWAVLSEEAERRLPIEDEGRAFDYRSQFQRDRDRVVYSRAFRRLRQKALAGILPAYEDHRRNRLTHTLEVAQFARTVGRALRLNEDLVEAVALAHDLGQPPFGPAGESALDDLLAGRLDGRGGPGLGDLGGFDGAWQGLRVVDLLEKRYAHAGLNLTDPVREGILKCGGDDRPAPEAVLGVRPGAAPLFEVQVVRWADRVSGALGDLDDALQAGALDIAQVEKLAAVRELRKKLGDGYPARAGRYVRANAIHRGLLHLFATGLVLSAERSLARWGQRHQVARAERFRALRDAAVTGSEVGLSAPAHRMLEGIEGLLEARVRRGFEVDRVSGRGRRVVTGLFMAYQADPRLLEDHVLLRMKEATGVRFLRDLALPDQEDEIAKHYRDAPAFVRVLADHLAAMTDAYAVTEHARLLQMGAVPIPSAEQLRRETGDAASLLHPRRPMQ